MGKIVIYSKESYEGSHNLLKSEKRLLLRAFVKFEGDSKKMSQALEISQTRMLFLLLAHFSSINDLK